jgi:glucose-1-phosphate thymidylyltransferase
MTIVTSKQLLPVYSYWVENPQRYGVVEFGKDDNVISIEEKPQTSKSNWAAIGLYFYDKEVIDLVKNLTPSQRGELEITDLNLPYVQRRRLTLERLGRGFAWFDAGTHDSLLEAAEFVRVLQRRQGQLVCAPEEVAFHNGWISAVELRALALKLEKTQYSRRLMDNLRT